MMPVTEQQMLLFGASESRTGVARKGDRRLALVLSDRSWLDFLADEWWPLGNGGIALLGVGAPRGVADPTRTQIVAWIDPALLPTVDVHAFREARWVETSIADVRSTDDEIAWPGPVPLHAVQSFTVASDADRRRVLALLKSFSNVPEPAQLVTVEPIARTREAHESPAITVDERLRPPLHWNSARGAAAMALWSVPAIDAWIRVLCESLSHSVDPAPSRALEAPWWAEPPWVRLASERLDGVSAAGDPLPLWRALVETCLTTHPRDGWRPLEFLSSVVERAISNGADRARTDELATSTRALLRDEQSVNPARAIQDPIGLVLQLVLLRPEPARFVDWARDLRSLSPGVWWSGATLTGALVGYRDLEARFRNFVDGRWRLAVRTWQMLSTTPPTVWGDFISSPTSRRQSGGFLITWDGKTCAERHETTRSMWLDADLSEPSVRARAIDLARAHAPRALRKFLSLSDTQIPIDGDGSLDVSGPDARQLLVRGSIRLSLPEGLSISEELDESAFRRWLQVEGIDTQLPTPRKAVRPPPTPPDDARSSVGANAMEDSAIPGLRIVEDFVTEGEERALLAAVDDSPWLGELKRRVQHYGWKYDYKARAIAPSAYLGPLPPWAQRVAEKLLRAGLVEELPDQVIVNEYVGRQGIAKHVDCVPCFRGSIVMISMLESWEMNFLSPDGEKVPRQLPRRSAAVMSEPVRSTWKHEIPNRKSEPWGPRGKRISLTFRKVNPPAGARIDRSTRTRATAARADSVVGEDFGQSLIYRAPTAELRTSGAQATHLVGPPEPSERFVVLAPHGVEQGGLEFVPETLKAAVMSLDHNDALAFPQFRGGQVVRSTGILRASDGTQFAVGLDGSIAMRRRLYHDRRGRGARVARGDVGLFSSLEQLLAMMRYARGLGEHSPRRVYRWSFRHELHGIRGRHLTGDAPARRDDPSWTMSQPSAEHVIALAGEIDLRAPAQVVGRLLDDVATRLAAFFDCEQVVQKMHAGSWTVDTLGAALPLPG